MPAALQPAAAELAPELTALLQVPWLAALGEPVCRQLALAARLRALRKGQSVLRHGVAVRHLVVLLAGRLELGLTGANGRRMVVGLAQPGQALGLGALFDARASLQDARAHTACQVLLLSRSDLLQAMQQHPALTDALLRLMAERMRALLSAYADRSLVPLRPRLVQLLLRLARQNLKAAGRPTAATGTVVLNLAQDDLAAMLGITRQHLNPVLRQLQAEGLLALGYRCITVPDLAALV